MNYKELPVFKGITPEIEAYLDRFDGLLQKNNLNLPIEEILVRKINLFVNYVDDKKTKKDNKDFVREVEERLQTRASKHGEVSLFFLERSLYGLRRDVNNDKKMSDLEYSKLINNWKSKANGLKVLEPNREVGDVWIYKLSPEYSSKEDVHRFILNVDPNQELFESLDKFALKYNCQYKCAKFNNTTYSRADSIVIYTADDRIEEQKNILSSIVKPYVRANGDNILDGEKITEGLFYATEKSRADVQKLMDEAQQIYPRLGEMLQHELSKTTKSHPLSLGQFTVYKDILDSVKKLKGFENSNLNNKHYTLQTILEEGIRTSFIKTDTPVITMAEINNTEYVKYKILPQNPNQLVADGFSKNGKPTFCFKYDRITKTYVYQGGKPEKTYSNDPNLNFAPLPDNVVNLLKTNRLATVNKAIIEAEMRNGVKIKENGYIYSIRKTKLGSHENGFVCKKEKDGHLITEIEFDKESGKYWAFDHTTSESFSNLPKLVKQNIPQLPPEKVNKIMQRYLQRIKLAEQSIVTGKISSNLNQRQK